MQDSNQNGAANAALSNGATDDSGKFDKVIDDAAFIAEFFSRNPAVCKDLTRRGLRDRQAIERYLIERMQLRDLVPLEVLKSSHLRKRAKAASAAGKSTHDLFVELRYSDAHGNLIDGVKRIRILDDNYEERKYHTPEGVPPAPYLLAGENWLKIKDDTSVPIDITEGEVSSAVANFFGVLCIGIPGVWSWQSRRAGFKFPLDLIRWQWKGRKVTITYDSDAQSNPFVLGAMHALARKLSERGALVFLRYLQPEPDGGKLGIDDGLIKYGREWLDSFSVEEFAEDAAHRKLDEQYLHVLNHDEFLEEATGIRRDRQRFLSNTERFRTTVYDKAGKVHEDVHAGEQYLKRPHRTVFDYEFNPAQGAITDSGNANLFRGWPVEPKEGPTELYDELLDHIVGGSDSLDERVMVRRYLSQWSAYPIKHPGTKLYVAPILWGVTEGCGKSLYGEVIAEPYGGPQIGNKNSYFREVSQKQLRRDFNKFAARALFVLANEISPTDKRENADFLKNLITQLTVAINDKYVTEVVYPDLMNWLFTSNHADAAYLSSDDSRRFLVLNIEAKLPYDKGAEIKRWATSPEGKAALMYRLLHTDCTGFEPTRPAPWTKAREEMVYAGDSSSDSFCRDIVAGARSGDGTSAGEGKPDANNDLQLVEDLVSIFKNRNGMTISSKAMSTSLKKVKGVASLDRVYLFDGPKGTRRIYAVANGEHWLKNKDTIKEKVGAITRFMGKGDKLG